MGLQRVIYTDVEGRKKVVLLPVDAPEEEAEKGIPLGPPSLAELNLPTEIEVRLSNELFHRGIILPNDALRKRGEIQMALQAAFRIDVDSIVTQYVGRDYRNARSQPPEDKPDAALHYRRPRKSRQ